MLRKIIRDLAVLLGLALSAATLPLFMAPLVVFRAEALADGRAYCIIVSRAFSDAGYHTATTLSDFVALRMWEMKDAQGGANFHAVLFIQSEAKAERYTRFNWSYGQFDFEEIIGQGHAGFDGIPCCQTQPHFAMRLPFF